MCGCPRAIIDGQKLFRLVNFANNILGNPIVDSPPTMDATFNLVFVYVAKYHMLYPGPTLGVMVELGVYCPSALSVFQTNQGLKNPYAIENADGSSAIYRPGDAQFAGLWALPDSGTQQVCVWDQFQCPRYTGVSEVQTIN